jgi:hypothetical protein
MVKKPELKMIILDVANLNKTIKRSEKKMGACKDVRTGVKKVCQCLWKYKIIKMGKNSSHM